MADMRFTVKVVREDGGTLTARSGSGGEVLMGPPGTPNAFTPVELLLIALGGCTGIDVVTVAPEEGVDVENFELTVQGTRPIGGAQLTSASVSYDVNGADTATVQRLIAAVTGMCTVGNSLQSGCPVSYHPGS